MAHGVFVICKDTFKVKVFYLFSYYMLPFLANKDEYTTRKALNKRLKMPPEQHPLYRNRGGCWGDAWLLSTNIVELGQTIGI